SKEEADERFPHVRVPVLTGGSSSTYYCDYAGLVSAYVVRSVRSGGCLANSAYSGLRCVDANNSPSAVDWRYGGGLYFAQ
ncbi:MAG: hypothetical protein U0L09_00570, partial [Christensenellales bacterium]|nr:hypothetical protein [Christensenellales bacterium]